MQLAALALAFTFLSGSSHAVPSVKMGYAPYSMASRHGIQGADKISGAPLSVGAWNSGSDSPQGNYYLASSGAPGHPGEGIITDDPRPTTFFIKSGQLFAYVNQTTVMHVNVIETSHPAPPAYYESPEDVISDSSPRLMKLQLSTKKRGVDGDFFYTVSALHFTARTKGGFKKTKAKEGEPEAPTNAGIWWACGETISKRGRRSKAIYMDYGTPNFRLRRAPAGCEGWTLHSLNMPVDD